MKKLFLASIAALSLSNVLVARADDVPSLKQCREMLEDQAAETPTEMACIKRYGEDAIYKPGSTADNTAPPPARVTVAPPYQGPPPIGWVYGPYTMCGDPPRCSTGVVNVPADGLNVRMAPNGPAVMSLVNGVPLIPLQKEGDWLLVAAACDLTPTFAWSWTAGVPLNRCWVYF